MALAISLIHVLSPNNMNPDVPQRFSPSEARVSPKRNPQGAVTSEMASQEGITDAEPARAGLTISIHSIFSPSYSPVNGTVPHSHTPTAIQGGCPIDFLFRADGRLTPAQATAQVAPHFNASWRGVTGIAPWCPPLMLPFIPRPRHSSGKRWPVVARRSLHRATRPVHRPASHACGGECRPTPPHPDL